MTTGNNARAKAAQKVERAMSDDLIDRLRSKGCCDDGCHCDEAADRNAELEAEVQRLNAGWQTANQAALEAQLAAATAGRVDDVDLLFDAYKGLLVLHGILDRMGLALGSATANRIADKIVLAHPEFPPRAALRAITEASHDRD